MPNNTITLQTAQAWAKNWNDKKKQFFETNDLKAFRVLGTVIADVMEPEGVRDIRTYFGLDNELNPHLIIVGVDTHGNDLIDPANGYHIYNYAVPCPNMCSSSTPRINP